MKYRITHTTKFNYSEAVPVCHNIVRLAPRSCRLQTRHDFRLLVHPDPHVLRERADVFGNQESYFSIEHAHRGLTVTTMSTVDVLPREPLDAESTAPWESLAQENFRAAHPKNLGVLPFYYPSPRVRPFSELQQYARKSFPKGRPILAAVQDLTARIHADFRYDPQSTTVQTPTEDVFQQRKGVCQDFAHLQIGCLRSLGLAARYVSGYLRTVPPPGKPRLVGADASHAWLSVYCGDLGWVDVDPTNDVWVSIDHITVGWGRDYSDVCPIQGVIVGGGEHRMSVSVDVAPVEGDDA